MRRRGPSLGCVAIAALSAVGWLVANGAAATAAPAPGAPAVVVGCLGVDPGATGSQIRVGLVVSSADGLYRAVFAGPAGPVQGEGRVAGGRGLIVVPATGDGRYDDLVLTNVDTGQAVDRGPLGDDLPFTVGASAVACDPAALVVPTGDPTVTTPTPSTTVAPTPAPTDAPTPDISTSAPLASGADATTTTTTDTPPWLLLSIPGLMLVTGGVVLLVRARSGSHSPPAT